jgi:crotonobetainyl-CoA:carnitine CoA-transferase CaiB-like acyl-CoA transferase
LRPWPSTLLCLAAPSSLPRVPSDPETKPRPRGGRRPRGRRGSRPAPPADPRRRAPLLGEHTLAVLAEAGYGAGEIGTLRDAGAI